MVRDAPRGARAVWRGARGSRAARALPGGEKIFWAGIRRCELCPCCCCGARPRGARARPRPAPDTGARPSPPLGRRLLMKSPCRPRWLLGGSVSCSACCRQGAGARAARAAPPARAAALTRALTARAPGPSGVPSQRHRREGHHRARGCASTRLRSAPAAALRARRTRAAALRHQRRRIRTLNHRMSRVSSDFTVPCQLRSSICC